MKGINTVEGIKGYNLTMNFYRRLEEGTTKAQGEEHKGHDIVCGLYRPM